MKASKIAKTVLDKAIVFAKWYMRRRRIVRAFIFLLFLSPIFIYSYWQSQTYMAKVVSPPEIRIQEETLPLPVTACNTFFSGKTLFIFGSLTVPQSCYILNNNTLLYPTPTGDSHIEIILSGNKSSPIAFVISLPVDENATVRNKTIKIEEKILVIYSSINTPVDAIRTLLDEYNLTDTFCRVATPSTSWGPKTVPEELYSQVC